MKLVCDCGRNVEFQPEVENFVDELDYEIDDVYDGYVHCSKSNYEIVLVAEHDEIWITCDCGKKIHLFT